MRRLAMTALAGCLFAGYSMAPGAAERPQPQRATTTSVRVADEPQDCDPNELRLYRALQKRIWVDFDDTPLTEALKQLSTKCGVNIVLDPRALEDEGVTPESTIKAAGRGSRLCTVLDRILAPLLLDYAVADEVIKVTSRLRARGDPVTVTYAVADLITTSEGGRTVPNSGAAQDLLERIVESVAPETWEHVGGRGTIRVFQLAHGLVIRQVPDVHDEIAELLEQLREERQRQTEADGTVYEDLSSPTG
jgi:hypothetical protein